MAAAELGALVASALSGAWRQSPPPWPLDDSELGRIAQLLLKSGGAALAWWRMQQTGFAKSAGAATLRDAFRLHTLQTAVRESEIGPVFAFLRSLGIEPLLGKGWAISRQYPAPGLRPYGDIDLYLTAEQYARAVAAFRSEPGAPSVPIDLHRGAGELDDRGFEQLIERSECVPLGSSLVRVLGPEDHLRLLCVHTLKHGAWRPLWLCDIAVALEARPATFDWEYFLSGDSRRSDWVACAIGLAHQLLGVRVDDTPVRSRATNLPGWLLPTVLKQWGVGQTPHGARLRMAHYLRHPSGVIEAVRVRWPNAIEATVDVRGPFNEFPRLPFQIGECFVRAVRLIGRLPRTLGWAR